MSFSLDSGSVAKGTRIRITIIVSSNRSLYNFCRKIIALPLLPAAVISDTFSRLCDEVTTNPILTQLSSYVQRTWMESSVWPVEAWNVYGQSVRTNNDCEGWHLRLNRKAQKHTLTFYLLVTLLYQEALEHC